MPARLPAVGGVTGMMDTAGRIMSDGNVGFAFARSGIPAPDDLVHFTCRYTNGLGGALDVPFTANFEPEAGFVLKCLAADLAEAEDDPGALGLAGDDEADTLAWLRALRERASAVLGEDALASLLAEASTRAEGLRMT